MSRNESIKVTCHKSTTVVVLLVSIIMLSLATCENALVEAAKAIPAEADQRASGVRSSRIARRAAS